MPRNGSGVYSKPAGTTAISGTTIESADYNTTIDDLVNDANLARPVVAGGTGAATAAGARTNLEVPGLNTANTFTAQQTLEASGEGGQLVVKETASGKVGNLDMIAGDNVMRIFHNMDGAGNQTWEFPSSTETKTNNTTMRYSDVLDEDDFATDSATRPPSQQSTGAYIADQIATMGGSQSGSAPVYAARAWAKFSTAGGTVSLTASGNVSSITDGGVGVYTVNFTTDMADVNFATLATATYRGSSALEGATAYTQTVSSVVLRAFEGSGGTAVDPGGMNVAVFR